MLPALYLLAQVAEKHIEVAEYILDSFKGRHMRVAAADAFAELHRLCLNIGLRRALITSALKRVEHQCTHTRQTALHVLAAMRAEDEEFAVEAATVSVQVASGRIR